MAETARVKISAASLRLPFAGCSPEYIRTTCKAACCRSTVSPTGTSIAVAPDERAAVESAGGIVVGGLLQPRPGERRCPFQGADHLCGLHGTPVKPFGCRASPFTINRNGTLIVRHRYVLLKCYRDGAKLPAYLAFRSSLDAALGREAAAFVADHLDGGGGDVTVDAPVANVERMRANTAIRSPQGDLFSGKAEAACA